MHDREAHPYPLDLRRKELSEQALARFLGNTNPVIPHARANCAVTIPFRRDHYLAMRHWRVMHGIESVDHEIKQDLLELNRICFNRRQIWLEQSLHLARLEQCIRVYHVRHIYYDMV